MTNEKYIETHMRRAYQGKHFQKEYHVVRVIGPSGPTQEFNVLGLDEVKRLIRGCWYHKVIRLIDGKVMNL